MQKFERLIKVFTPNSSGQSNKDRLPQGSLYHKLRLRLDGNLVVGAAAATLVEDGILNFVKSIRVSNNIGQVIKDVAGEIQHKKNSYLFGTPPAITQPAIAVGTNPFSITYDVNFSCVGLKTTQIGNVFIRPDMTAYQSKTFAGEQLAENYYDILLGVATDIAAAGGGGTVAVSGLQAYLYLIETDGVNQEFPKNFENTLTTRKSITGMNQKIELKTKRMLKRFVFITETTGNINSNAVVDEIRLTANAGKSVLRSIKWLDLLSENKVRYGLENLQTGFAILELDTEGLLGSDLVDASKYDQMDIEIDTASSGGTTALVTVESQEILP